MNVDTNKAIFLIEFGTQNISGFFSHGSPKPIMVIAKDYNHADSLAREYVDSEYNPSRVIDSNDDGSLTDKEKWVVSAIKKMENMVIY